MNKPERLVQRVLALGAAKAALVPVEKMRFSEEFRKMCESNACGMYGKSWMCPPYVGQIDQLIWRAKQYPLGLVYQIVGQLEDSYDFEGMMQAGQEMNRLARVIRDTMTDDFGANALHLAAGGCRLCERCTKLDEQPCRFPQRALASLEAYGVNVSQLAQLAGMNYTNGQNTVTYFGMVLFDPQQDAT